jgi:hypothetical protein
VEKHFQPKQKQNETPKKIFFLIISGGKIPLINVN